MWTWVAVFATASFAASGVASASSAGSHRRVRRDRQRRGGLRAGRLHRRSHRQSSRRDVGDARAAPTCAALTLVVYGGSPCLLYALIMLWGFAVVADSAQFSALVSEHAPRDHVGTALTLQTCVGLPADDGDDRAAAASGGGHQLAMGIALAGTRSITGCLGDETPDRLTA